MENTGSKNFLGIFVRFFKLINLSVYFKIKFYKNQIQKRIQNISRDINLKSKFYNDLNFIINRAEINKIKSAGHPVDFFVENFMEKNYLIPITLLMSF